MVLPMAGPLPGDAADVTGLGMRRAPEGGSGAVMSPLFCSKPTAPHSEDISGQRNRSLLRQNNLKSDKNPKTQKSLILQIKFLTPLF
jgi:hypothetical protein